MSRSRAGAGERFRSAGDTIHPMRLRRLVRVACVRPATFPLHAGRPPSPWLADARTRPPAAPEQGAERRRHRAAQRPCRRKGAGYSLRKPRERGTHEAGGGRRQQQAGIPYYRTPAECSVRRVSGRAHARVMRQLGRAGQDVRRGRAGRTG